MIRKNLLLFFLGLVVFCLSGFAPSPPAIQMKLADDDPELPWYIYDALSGVSVSFVENFDEFNEENYAYGELEHRNGLIELTSYGDWEGYFVNLYEHAAPIAYLTRLQLTEENNFIYSMESGVRWEPGYREWSFIEYGQARSWMYEEQTEYFELDGDLAFEVGLWYDVLLAIKEDGAALVYFWEVAEPEASSHLEVDLGREFQRDNWNLLAVVENSQLLIDHFFVLRFNDFGPGEPAPASGGNPDNEAAPEDQGDDQPGEEQQGGIPGGVALVDDSCAALDTWLGLGHMTVYGEDDEGNYIFDVHIPPDYQLNTQPNDDALGWDEKIILTTPNGVPIDLSRAWIYNEGYEPPADSADWGWDENISWVSCTLEDDVLHCAAPVAKEDEVVRIIWETLDADWNTCASGIVFERNNAGDFEPARAIPGTQTTADDNCGYPPAGSYIIENYARADGGWTIGIEYDIMQNIENKIPLDGCTVNVANRYTTKCDDEADPMLYCYFNQKMEETLGRVTLTTPEGCTFVVHESWSVMPPEDQGQQDAGNPPPQNKDNGNDGDNDNETESCSQDMSQSNCESTGGSWHTTFCLNPPCPAWCDCP